MLDKIKDSIQRCGPNHIFKSKVAKRGFVRITIHTSQLHQPTHTRYYYSLYNNFYLLYNFLIHMYIKFLQIITEKTTSFINSKFVLIII